MRVLILVLALIQSITCARILVVFYFPGYSHFVQGETLFKELAARGHEVTVVSAYPQKEKLNNYIDITLTALNDVVEYIRNPETMKTRLSQWKLGTLLTMYPFGCYIIDVALKDKSFQDLLHTNETYDVIIVEHYLTEVLFGLMYRFEAPLIAMSTLSASPFTNRILGNPTSYAAIPNLLFTLSTNMNLWERTWNTALSFIEYVYYYLLILPVQNLILHKHFPDAPPISDLIQNVSLVFVNSHPVFGTAVPLLPNMIEVGGLHVQGNKENDLPEDLQKYLDEAAEGVVYFSMGSILKSKDLDEDKLEHILRTFSKLKMKVLWKFEADELPGKPSNVRIEKWLPQPSVLAHENVKIFITHGGKSSIIESIYYGKPILCIPMFGDQLVNSEEAVSNGYGVYVSYKTLTEDTLTTALTELINNPKYDQEAKYRSNAFRNLPVTPLDNAVHWVEYVVKHKGAPHLKNPAVNLPMYQYLLLDVIFLILFVIWLSKKLFLFGFKKLFGNSKGQKLKTN